MVAGKIIALNKVFLLFCEAVDLRVAEIGGLLCAYSCAYRYEYRNKKSYTCAKTYHKPHHLISKAALNYAILVPA